MTVLELPTFTNSSPQVGPRLDFDPIELSAAMERDNHALSKALLKDPNWVFFTRKGLEVSAPIRALFAAEYLGLTKKQPDGEYLLIDIMDILQHVNDTLVSQRKKPVTVGSVLANLSKAVKYVQAAFGICLIPDRKLLKIQISNGIATEKNINKYFKRVKPQIIKIAKELDNARALNFDIDPNILSSEEQKALALLKPAE